MNLKNVMDQIATQLDTISGLRCYPYPADSVTPPAVIVSYPDTVTFDETYGRGMDRLTLPVVLVMGKVYDRATRDNLMAYCNGSGSTSVKQVLESGTYTAFDTIRVSSVEFDAVSIAGTDYAAALFSLDIAGQGE